jgi:2,3-bisphosphoglycerate-independent phosphoglycerate mutase
MSVIFLFIDGIGLGDEGGVNPLYDPKWKSFDELTDGQGLGDRADPVLRDGLYYKPVDANLDVKGLPQSGTGQAALFSGENASKIAGRHFGPFPHSRTRHLLEEKSLFHQVMDAGFRPHFINAYPDIFFDKMSEKNRWTCTTLMASSAGQSLNGLNDIKEGRAITAEIVQDAWREQLKLDVRKIKPETAAVRLIKSLEEYDLVMFEYYLTDKAGHSMSRDMSERVLRTLDRFIGHLLKIKSADDHLVICSDHGNLENLSVKTHTRNPVPLIVHGREASKINNEANSIMDVPRVINELLQQD